MNNNMNLVGEEEHLHHNNEQRQHNLPVKSCTCAIDLRELISGGKLGDLFEERVKKANEPMFQKLESLELLLTSSSLSKQPEPSVSRSFRLCFKGHMPKKIFTKDNIEDQGASLELELCDDTGKRLEQLDPGMKNLKVMISPLVGFKIYDSDNFTLEDFNSNIAIPRDGKPALLRTTYEGYEVSLTNGIARVCGISFTDNSSSRMDGRFRLGARVMKGLPSGSVVRPAVTEAFRVLENRSEVKQKHGTPLPQDEISCLVNIGKQKTAQSAKEKKYKLFTVLDFRQLLKTDERTLQQILQLPKMKWKKTVEHAKACNLNNLDKYKYVDDKSGDILLLKPDFDIESVTFKGQNDQPYDSLNESQKKKVHELRKTAFEKRMELEKFDASSNQTPVQDGLECSYNIERQEQPAAPTLTACSNPSANMYLSTTVTDHDTSQQLVMSTSGCLTNGAYEGNYTNMAIGSSMAQQGATNGFALQPSFNFTDNTAADQDKFQQHDMSAFCSQTSQPYDEDFWAGVRFEGSSENGKLLSMIEDFLVDTPLQETRTNESESVSGFVKLIKKTCYVIKVRRTLQRLRNRRCGNGNGEIPIPNIQENEESAALVRISVQQDLTPPAKKPKRQ